MFVCSKCERSLHDDMLFKGKRCIECERAHRRQYKRKVRAAARPRANAHVIAWHRHRMRKPRQVDAHVKCFRLWLQTASADEKGERAISAGTPWLDRRLSDSERYALRYQLDADFNAKERARRQARKAARGDGIGDLIRSVCNGRGRSRTVERRLGYSIDEFRAHFEALFTEGMCWDAFERGEIHIDHVIPQSFFDLSNPEQWRQCWSLSNLQPLWAADNFAKGWLLPASALSSNGSLLGGLM